MEGHVLLKIQTCGEKGLYCHDTCPALEIGVADSTPISCRYFGQDIGTNKDGMRRVPNCLQNDSWYMRQVALKNGQQIG